MAAFPQLNAAPELCTNYLQGTPSFACLFSTQFRRRSYNLPALGRRRYTTRTAVTCNNDGGSNSSDDRLFRPLARPDRREVVLGGLGGLAGLGLDRTAAFASPIAPPDLSKCHSATVNDENKGTIQLECCPPFSDKAIEFTLPKVSKLRVRPAVHKVDAAYVQKFERAIKMMKDLPGDDPRNFYQQANVHCAYCNDAYDQVGVPNAHNDQRHIQVHFCWLFFPFHRIYLYYWERILGKLIGDDNFAIPFWNWDHPEGMVMPSIYTNTKSPLFNPNRDPAHLPPTTAILDFDDKSPTYADRNRQIQENLNVMYRQMVLQGKNADLFMGARYVTGSATAKDINLTSGSLELTPHNNLHTWSGDPANDFREDMGNFYSAGRDCLFYALHANVDRMWDVWTKTLKKKNFDDSDWLNAAFYFYDENKQLVRVKVSDCLSSETMGVTYEQRDLPWLETKPVRKRFESIEKTKKLATKTLAQFPLTLTSTVSTVVTRPKTSRSAREKEAAEEVLVISGIQVDKTIAAKFDVFVNAPNGEDLTASAAELVGSFTNVILKKQKGANVKPLTVDLRLDVTDLLDSIGADGDDTIVVTLVPRQGTGKVRIQGVGIEFIKNF